MLSERNERPSLRVTFPGVWRVFITLIVLGSAVVMADLYARTVQVAAMDRLLFALQVGNRLQQVRDRLHAQGSLINAVDVSHGVDLVVPPGGHVILFDSYQLTSTPYCSVDFAVAVDRQQRVVAVQFLNTTSPYFQ